MPSKIFSKLFGSKKKMQEMVYAPLPCIKINFKIIYFQKEEVQVLEPCIFVYNRMKKEKHF
jgi:hypothetical protein